MHERIVIILHSTNFVILNYTVKDLCIYIKNEFPWITKRHTVLTQKRPDFHPGSCNTANATQC